MKNIILLYFIFLKMFYKQLFFNQIYELRNYYNFEIKYINCENNNDCVINIVTNIRL